MDVVKTKLYRGREFSFSGRSPDAFDHACNCLPVKGFNFRNGLAAVHFLYIEVAQIERFLHKQSAFNGMTGSHGYADDEKELLVAQWVMG